MLEFDAEHWRPRCDFVAGFHDAYEPVGRVIDEKNRKLIYFPHKVYSDNVRRTATDPATTDLQNQH